MRGFNPVNAASLEMRMWRSYYAGNRLALFADLYRLSRGEYHFSPWDSTRMAWHAARAARSFQTSRSRAEAQRALPMIKRFYDVIRSGAGENFDTSRAARQELEWWQLRREQKTWREYGQTIAAVTETVYRVHSPGVAESALIRAEMMNYRDTRGSRGMTNADWRHIETNLLRGWTVLKTAVQRPK